MDYTYVITPTIATIIWNDGSNETLTDFDYEEIVNGEYTKPYIFDNLKLAEYNFDYDENKDKFYFKCEEIDRSFKDLVNTNDLASVSLFFNSLFYNPSYNSREQLTRFVAHNKIKLSKYGQMILYKVVSENYTDKYSGTFDNSVGLTVSMSREDVDDNPNNTCSSGLHVCTLPYLKDFFYCNGDRVVEVMVWPSRVVSVPTDYNNTKMRVENYTVNKDVTDEVTKDW